ncbi:MAG: 16S rRNA (guanine(527)-N(7))-methyltransferase RsmG [Alphaproteobacteria bacterium]|nr:16S rRNA (guanine(527)-N(7))-methyltransferase RsmG [Alphaproteobacteria bacterium]MDE2161676.1 16S rRNA (guanine(527)-N(7))-methyltransferase RsmG [Alphaproteobacteria bacterium]
MSDPVPPEEAFGPEEFAAATGVSRETLAKLKTYVGLLADWNTRHNLVSKASLEEVWRRHVWDSAQLAPMIPPAATTLADFGSGAGFPGLVLAVMLEGRVKVTLFEATRKKAEFLRTVAERLGVDAQISNERIEGATVERPFDVVTSRACARLSVLLDYAQRFAGPQTICLFLKGENAGAELTEARRSWRIDLRQHPSLTHPLGVILEIRKFHHVRAKRKKPN